MMAIDRIAATNRWRRRHAADKLVLGGGLLGMSLVLPPLPAAPLILTAAAAAAVAGAGVSAIDYGRLLLVPAGFLAAGSIVLAVTVAPGSSLALTITPESAALAATVTLRALAATAALLLIVLTTPVADLLGQLRRAGIPAPITDIALLMYRLIFLAADQAARIRLAQSCRLGYATRWRALRSTGQLAAALLPRLMDRAQRMEVGLAARGYGGDLRLLPPVVRPSPAFITAAVALLGVIAALTVLLRAPGGAALSW